jgi:hypothetical protein
MNPQSRVPSRRSLYRLLAVTAALVPALILAVSGPTQAATTNSAVNAVDWSSPDAVLLPSCPTATLCTFRDSNYGGTRWDFAYSAWPHDEWICLGALGTNGQISSFYNRRSWISYFAKDCPAGSNRREYAGGTAVPNLGDGRHLWQDGTSMNDSISAIALGSSSVVNWPPNG